MRITIKAARINAGLTQKRAAELLGVSNKTLVNFETGKAFPRVDFVDKLSVLYNIPKDDFIFLCTKNT